MQRSCIRRDRNKRPKRARLTGADLAADLGVEIFERPPHRLGIFAEEERGSPTDDAAVLPQHLGKRWASRSAKRRPSSSPSPRLLPIANNQVCAGSQAGAPKRRSPPARTAQVPQPR